jgi:hypothetical protein
MKFIRHYLNSTTQGYSARPKLAFSLVTRSKNASASATQIDNPVLPTHQDEVRHRRGRHGNLSSPCTPNSSGRAGLPNNPRHQFLQANSRTIDTHLGGGTLGHLGPIISDDSYAMIAPTTDAGPTLWTTPQASGRAPANTDGTAAQISATCHIWEEDVQTYRTCTSVQQALNKQIISVFEPMYLDILSDTSSRLTTTSPRSTSRSILNTCAWLGILNSQLSPCSTRFKILPTILKPGASSLDTRNKSTLGMHKYLQQVTS